MKRIIPTLMAALLLSACSADKAQNIVGPGPAPTGSGTGDVTSINVEGPSSIGSSFQLVATALMMDNTTRDITTVSKWASSNPSVAQVSSTGMVTVSGSGPVDVLATYGGVTGSLFLSVSPHPATFTLNGYVHEGMPTDHPLAGVVVQLISGPDAGMTTTTDAGGVYQFGVLHPGEAVLQYSKDGYETYQTRSLALSLNTSIYVWIYPTTPTNADGAPATARCQDGSWSWAGSRDQACTGSGGIAYVVCPGPMCQAAPSEHSHGISRITN